MDVKDFYFDLPQELIAQDPLEDRSASRLLVLDKKTGESGLTERMFTKRRRKLFHTSQALPIETEKERFV